MKISTKSEIETAKRWQCNVRTVRRWKKSSAPLHDEKKMLVWLSAQQRLPINTATLLASRRIAASGDKAPPPGPLLEGVAQALRRLEAMEARAFAAFERAITIGDPVATKSTRDNWLKISESLRRFDLQVEIGRRASGELLPREQVELLLTTFGNALAGALVGFEDVARMLYHGTTPEAINGTMQRARQALTFSAMSATYAAEPRPPRWLLDCWRHATQLAPWPAEAYTALAECCRQAVVNQGKDLAVQYAKRVDSEKRWRECQDPVEKSRIYHEELHPQTPL
jgi:hypothetical protein